MIKMGVACGLECLKDIPSEKVDAIITATGLGCLADTEKFMNALMDNREQMLNPTAFIQSTFNTVGAQLALLLKIHAYNVTYVHRGLSFESALIDGIISIAEGKQHVLAGGMGGKNPYHSAAFRTVERNDSRRGSTIFPVKRTKRGTDFCRTERGRYFYHPDECSGNQ